MRQPKTFSVISLLVAVSILFSKCFRDKSFAGNDPRGPQYAGTAACASCHKNIFYSYTHSNHYKTSSTINADSLKKMVAATNGNFYFTDSSNIHVEEKNGLFFQSHFLKDKELVSRKFDIAFGSAEKAQTYGYWNENKLFQLPLTWFAGMNIWANSPGFPAHRAYFDRVIESRCFECHATYINKEFVQSGSLKVEEKLDRNSIIYGIDCERCHGPASEHVQYHKENPSAAKAMYIVSIKSLTRQQKLDVCATCHSGNDQGSLKSLFAFLPGDTLSNFYFPDFGGRNEPDVHGKQLQLLQASKCFQGSQMTCASCHNSHEPEKNKMAVFISKCMDCHQNSAHASGMLKQNEQVKQGYHLENNNCIDCHMPLQRSKTIYFNSGAELKQIPYFLRTHKIGIYKKES